MYAELTVATTDDALRERYAALSIAEGDPVGEHVRLALLAEREPAPWIDDALVDLRARYGHSIFAPWCASPFGRSLGRWLADLYGKPVLMRGLIGHFPGFDRDLAVAESLGPIESASAGPRASRVGTRIRDFRGVLDESFPANDDIAPRSVFANWSRLPTWSLANCEELSIIGEPNAEPELVRRAVEAAPSLRRLSFRTHEAPSPATIEAIAALRHLEHLGIGSGGDRDWAGAARRAGAFPKLRSLSLDQCIVDIANVAELAQRVGLYTLSLQILDDRELPTLLDGLAHAPLASLCIAGEPDADVPMCLAPFRTARLPELRRLAVYECAATAVEALAPLSSQLTELTLNHCMLSADALDGLFAGASLAGLRQLAVPYDAISATAARALAEAAPSLVHLGLDADRLPMAQLAELLAALGELRHLKIPQYREPLALVTAGVAPRLRTLTGSVISDGPDAILAELARSPHARTLRVTDVPDLAAVSDATIDALIDSPHLAELGQIDISRVTSPARLDRLLRRFGHRAILRHDVVPGPLPEPDLDPFWRR